VWLSVWAPAVFLAGLAGLMVGPQTSIFAMGGLGAAMAALTTLPLDPRASPSRSAGHGPVWITAARRAVCAGAAVLVLGALVALLGDLVFLLVPVVALSSPWVLERVWRQVHATAGQPAGEPRSGGDEGGDLVQARAEQLCQEWRASHRAIAQAQSVEALAEAARRRRTVLDEMERRNVRGFHAWLATNPTAYDDPECFLVVGTESERPPLRD
jgi:hypothetical protein